MEAYNFVGFERFFFQGTKGAQEHTLNTAEALTVTARDLYCREGLLDKAKAEFAEDTKTDSL